MINARIEAFPTLFADVLTDTAARSKHSHKVWAVDHTPACEISLPQEARILIGDWLSVQSELEPGRKQSPPLVKLMVELRNYSGKAAVVKTRARILAAEKVMDAIQEPTHRETGKEI